MLPKHLIALIVLSAASFGFCSQTYAGGYTVYIHNVNWGSSSDGMNWERSGFEHDVYKSFDACWSSVIDRVIDNWIHGTNNEAFLIVWTDARPDWGCFCRPYISGNYSITLYSWPTGNQGVWFYFQNQWYGPYGNP